MVTSAIVVLASHECHKTIPSFPVNPGTIGGIGNEKLNLIPLLPFLIEDLLPKDELAWQVILDLKKIVDGCGTCSH